MIIVEGCDNTGKTTLVTKLAQDLRLISVNNRKRPQSRQESEDYLHALLPLVKSHPTIFDRWQPISEPIYGPICRNTRILPFDAMEAQHRILSDVVHRPGPLVIYCRPKDSTILNFGDREQMTGVIEHAHTLIQEYDAMMPWLHDKWFRVLHYDFEDSLTTYESLVAKIRAHFGATK